eukprot:2828331-Prymnesium_polylepis.1
MTDAGEAGDGYSYAAVRVGREYCIVISVSVGASRTNRGCAVRGGPGARSLVKLPQPFNILLLEELSRRARRALGCELRSSSSAQRDRGECVCACVQYSCPTASG